MTLDNYKHIFRIKEIIIKLKLNGKSEKYKDEFEEVKYFQDKNFDLTVMSSIELEYLKNKAKSFEDIARYDESVL